MPPRPRENRFAASLGELAANPWAIAAVAAVARLFVGLALLGTYGEAFPRASDDGDSYDAAARWLVSGDAVIHGRLGDSLLETSPDPAARWPSGYWLFLAGLYRLFGHQFAPPVILQAWLAGAGVAAFYAISTRVLPHRVALLATYLVATSGTLVVLSATLAAEALYIPFLSLGAWAALRAAEATRLARALAWGALCGGFFGVAEAMRPVALPVFVAVLAWLAWRSSLLRSRPGLVLVPAAFLLVLAPFAARDVGVLGRVAVFTVGGAEALRDQPEGTDLTDRLARLGFDPYRLGAGPSIMAVAARPSEVLTVVAESLPERLATVFLVGGWGPLGEPLPSLFGQSGILVRALIWLLALAGGILLVRHARPNARAAAWLLMLYVLAVLLPFLILGKPLVRYRAPADPVFVLWTVAGAWACWRLAKRLMHSMASTQLPRQET